MGLGWLRLGMDLVWLRIGYGLGVVSFRHGLEWLESTVTVYGSGAQSYITPVTAFKGTLPSKPFYWGDISCYP